jgi:hypothetical protein
MLPSTIRRFGRCRSSPPEGDFARKSHHFSRFSVKGPLERLSRYPVIDPQIFWNMIRATNAKRWRENHAQSVEAGHVA